MSRSPPIASASCWAKADELRYLPDSVSVGLLEELVAALDRAGSGDHREGALADDAVAHRDAGVIGMNRAVEVLAQRYTLNDSERAGVLRHLIAEGQLSGYGLVNAVTHYSQEVEDYDRATEFEALSAT